LDTKDDLKKGITELICESEKLVNIINDGKEKSARLEFSLLY